MSAMTVLLFWSGWLPIVDWSIFAFIPGFIWFILKVCAILFLFLLVRATFPRYRYDQLMYLGWKCFLPLTLFWVMMLSGVMLYFDLLPNG